MQVSTIFDIYNDIEYELYMMLRQILIKFILNKILEYITMFPFHREISRRSSSTIVFHNDPLLWRDDPLLRWCPTTILNCNGVPRRSSSTIKPYDDSGPTMSMIQIPRCRWSRSHDVDVPSPTMLMIQKPHDVDDPGLAMSKIRIPRYQGSHVSSYVNEKSSKYWNDIYTHAAFINPIMLKIWCKIL